MSEQFYCKPPHCMHEMIHYQGSSPRCSKCGAVLLWVVPVTIDYGAAVDELIEAATRALVEGCDVRPIVDAALGVADG